MANLRDLIDARFGVRTETRIDPLTASVGLAAVAVLPNDPARLAFTIVNLGAVAVYVKPRQDVSASSGIRLSPNGGSTTAVWDEDFEVTGYEWWAIADAAATAIFTLAVRSI